MAVKYTFMLYVHNSTVYTCCSHKSKTQFPTNILRTSILPFLIKYLYCNARAGADQEIECNNIHIIGYQKRNSRVGKCNKFICYVVVTHMYVIIANQRQNSTIFTPLICWYIYIYSHNWIVK